MFCQLFLILLYEFHVIVSGAYPMMPLFPGTREEGTTGAQV
jgi:hypothetical protein